MGSFLITNQYLNFYSDGLFLFESISILCLSKEFFISLSYLIYGGTTDHSIPLYSFLFFLVIISLSISNVTNENLLSFYHG